jgi:hypothetical protein
MPVAHWNMGSYLAGFNTSASFTAVLADLGSLALEFTRLSQLTGNAKYYDAVHRVMVLFEEQQNLTTLPGTLPINANPSTENFHWDTQYPLGACRDSFYEYLIKMVGLLGVGEGMYEKVCLFYLPPDVFLACGEIPGSSSCMVRMLTSGIRDLQRRTVSPRNPSSSMCYSDPCSRMKETCLWQGERCLMKSIAPYSTHKWSTWAALPGVCLP